jgi:hypothetical protein
MDKRDYAKSGKSMNTSAKKSAGMYPRTIEGTQKGFPKAPQASIKIPKKIQGTARGK